MSYDQDRRFFKKIRFSRINCIEDLQRPGFTVRVLRWIARFLINNQMGKTITKAQFGKYVSNMNKSELIHAIWYVRDTILKCPNNVIRWHDEHHSYRIRSCSYEEPNGKFLHTVYIGFPGKDYHNAVKMQAYLQSKGLAELVCLRRSKRSANSLKYELKIWGINSDILKELIKKDIATAASDAKKLAFAVSWEEVYSISNAWHLEYKVEVSKHLKNNYPAKYETIKSWKSEAMLTVYTATKLKPKLKPRPEIKSELRVESSKSLLNHEKNGTIKDSAKTYFDDMFGYQREEFPKDIGVLQSLIDTARKNVGGNLILDKVKKQCQLIGYQIVKRGDQLKIVDPQEF